MNFPLFIARKIYADKGDKKKVSRPAIRIATIGVALGLAVMAFPVLKVFVDKTLNVLLTGLGLHSQRSLDTCLLVMVQESIPAHCIFSYLELHCYNHWSYIELYIWSTASSLVIIIIGGSVIPLLIQDIIILWNKQNTHGIVNNISWIKSKYFSHEPPTPNQFFLKDCQD